MAAFLRGAHIFSRSCGTLVERYSQHDGNNIRDRTRLSLSSTLRALVPLVLAPAATGAELLALFAAQPKTRWRS